MGERRAGGRRAKIITHAIRLFPYSKLFKGFQSGCFLVFNHFHAIDAFELMEGCTKIFKLFHWENFINFINFIKLYFMIT